MFATIECSGVPGAIGGTIMTPSKKKLSATTFSGVLHTMFTVRNIRDEAWAPIEAAVLEMLGRHDTMQAGRRYAVHGLCKGVTANCYQISKEIECPMPLGIAHVLFG